MAISRCEDADRDVQLFDPPAAIFHGRRRGALAQSDAGTRGVQQADRLVGQLSARDVAAGELDRIDQGFVADPHLVVFFQRGRQAADHLDRRRLVGFVDFDDLKPPREGRVFLEVLLVLRPRCGGDGAQFAACQCRFEQIRRVALAAAARADQGVGFIDEQDDGNGRGFDFADHRFQSVLKLAAHARPRLQQAQVE